MKPYRCSLAINHLLADRNDVLRLLTDLLGFYSSCILPAEAELCNGHVIQNDVEVFSSFDQLPPDEQRHLDAA